MHHSRLLELIWQGDIQPATGLAEHRMQRAMRALLPLRSVFLAAAHGLDRSFALTAESELLSEVSLGDVLAEELSVDVASGTLVVIVDEKLLCEHISDDELSYELGLVVAETLLGVMRSGIFPLERETNALYAMASSYYGLIEGAGFSHLGLVPARFRAGLAAGLCTYWAGARTTLNDTSGLSLRPEFLSCPQLLAYLRKLDGNFSAPDRIPAGLMLFAGQSCSYEAWLFRIWNAVSAKLDAHAARICEEAAQEDARVQMSRKN